jgi:hypothetical protein
MSQNQNMGRKSHIIQDAQFEQNAAGLQDEIGNQPSRPTVHSHKATKKIGKEPPIRSSSTERPRRIM